MRVYKNLCPATICASTMVANMWKNSLKNVESDNNKMLYETLLDFLLQRNGTYFLNKRRISNTVLQKYTLIGMFLVLRLANHWHFQQYSAPCICSKGLIMFTQSIKQWEVCGYGSANIIPKHGRAHCPNSYTMFWNLCLYHNHISHHDDYMTTL